MVKIIEQKPSTIKLETADAEITPELAEAIDAFAEAKAELEEADAIYKPIAAAASKAKAVLEAQLDEVVGAAAKGSFFTEHNALQYGERGEKVTEMDKDKILELLGVKTFLRLAAIPVTKLRAALTADEVAEVVTVEKSASRRTLKTSAR